MSKETIGIMKVTRPITIVYILKNINVLSLFFVLLSISSIAQKGRNQNVYYEDLNVLRPTLDYSLDSVSSKNTVATLSPKQDITPTNQVNGFLDPLLDSINRFNMTRKLCDGFSIQIYSGQDQIKAIEAKNKLDNSDLHLTADLEYEQPKFQVRCGYYFSRLEAQKDLVILQRLFDNAILVPCKIILNR